MSAGNFTKTLYQDNQGNVYNCRVQPETLAFQYNGATNTAPAGPADVPVRARMTGSRRRSGCRARSVRVRFTDAVPDGYSVNQIIEIPILQQSIWQTMTADESAAGTYLTLPIEYMGKSDESVR